MRLHQIQGGVCAPSGFLAAGVRCGVKAEGKDLALVYCPGGATAAGTFTTNLMRAAPVRLSQQRVKAGWARAVVINSGNANACTGEQGFRDAVAMGDAVAAALGVAPAEVLVCSTGVIGQPLPLAKIAEGIKQAATARSETGGDDAAQAIITTDTGPKQAAVEFEVEGGLVRVGGMAKGAGMICPDMATMISVITTDAGVDAETLRVCLRAAVERSFNCITVDGDTSTNDTVLALASRESGVQIDAPEKVALFRRALEHVTYALAMQIARDGEGATRLLRLTVKGARSFEEARRLGRTIANSPLVKCALAGADPNWGRVLAAAGRAGVHLHPERVELALGAVTVVRGGARAEYDEELARRAVSGDEVEMTLDLHLGDESATVYTCDLTEEYVRINAQYHT